MIQYVTNIPKSSGRDFTLAVLSTRIKPGLVDTSTATERAEWIGREIVVKGKNAVIIGAARSKGVWFLQYEETK